MLHDSAVLASVESRLGRLSKDSTPAWGQMTVDQMLWHVNQALGASLGLVTQPQDRSPLPRPVMRFLVLKMPWPKSAPTNQQWVARERYDFEAERTKCRDLVRTFAARPLDTKPAPHPLFGQMSGRDQSCLHAKHLNHHLKQFGV